MKKMTNNVFNGIGVIVSNEIFKSKKVIHRTKSIKLTICNSVLKLAQTIDLEFSHPRDCSCSQKQ